MEQSDLQSLQHDIASIRLAGGVGNYVKESSNVDLIIEKIEILLKELKEAQK